MIILIVVKKNNKKLKISLLIKIKNLKIAGQIMIIKIVVLVKINIIILIKNNLQ